MRYKKENRKASIPIVYNKSNLIINAIGKPSATSQKLMNMALSCVTIDPPHSPEELQVYKNIEGITKVDYSTGIVSVFKQADFLKLLPGRNGSWKRTRDYLCSSKTGLIQEFTMNIMGKDGKYSGATALITGTYFDPDTKMIYVKFQDSEEMRNILTDLKNTTRLKLNTITQFGISYSIRLYELLESIVRKENWEDKRDKKEIRKRHECILGTEKLKWTMGYCYPNAKTPSAIANVIHDKVSECKTDEDFDKIYYLYKQYLAGTRWADFERDVLSKVMDELNEKSQMTSRSYSYEPLKNGGKRFSHIKFIIEEISNEEPVSDNTILEVIDEPDKEQAISDVRDILDKDIFFSGYFTSSDCYSLYKEASGDIKRIEKAYEAFIQYAKSQLQKKGDSIKPLAMMISFIKRNAEINREISYEDYYAAHVGDMSIEQEVLQAKRIIRDSVYDVANISEQDLNYLLKGKKNLCISLGIRPSECDNFDINTVCLLLKKSDELKSLMDHSFTNDANGQVSMVL